MNHLVILDARAGELEKILSGVKTMLIKEFDPTQATTHPIHPGDSLYFLRDQDECAVRVRAAVIRVRLIPDHSGEDLCHTLKEMQPRLKLTEDQYNFWSTKGQVLLVEFESAQKIGVIRVAPQKVTHRSNWTAFESISQITGCEVTK